MREVFEWAAPPVGYQRDASGRRFFPVVPEIAIEVCARAVQGDIRMTRHEVERAWFALFAVLSPMPPCPRGRFRIYLEASEVAIWEQAQRDGKKAGLTVFAVEDSLARH